MWPPGLAALVIWRDRVIRPADPLKRPRRRHDIEAIFERQRQSVADFKAKVPGFPARLACHGEQGIVAIHAHNPSMRSDHSGDAGGNRACAAAYVEHRHTGLQERRETPMIALEGSAVEYARVGSMHLFAHCTSMPARLTLRAGR